MSRFLGRTQVWFPLLIRISTICLVPPTSGVLWAIWSWKLPASPKPCTGATWILVESPSCPQAYPAQNPPSPPISSPLPGWPAPRGRARAATASSSSSCCCWRTAGLWSCSRRGGARPKSAAWRREGEGERGPKMGGELFLGSPHQQKRRGVPCGCL